MATSARQIAANQANARKSTGPRTEEGKGIACFNARRHGITGQFMIRTPEEHAAYDVFSSLMMPDLAPATVLERTFAERIISDSWRLTRATTVEQTLFAIAAAADPFDTGDREGDVTLDQSATFRAELKTFNLITLYQQRIQRAIHRDIEALRKMQNERRLAAMPAPRPQAVATPAATPIRQSAEKKITSLENGFDFSSAPGPSAPRPKTSRFQSENNGEKMAA